MSWLVLSLVCAFSLATADALTKRYLAAYSPLEAVLVRFGYAGMMMVPLVLVNPLPPVPPAFWGLLALLVPLELLAMWFYVRAIQTSPLALTLPYLAFTPVLVTVTGYVVLGETVPLVGLVGVLLVVAGAWLLNVERLHEGVLAPFAAISHEPGARFMLATAALYSLTAVFGKAAMAHATPASFGPFYFALLGVATLVLFGGRRRAGLAVLWRRPWAGGAVGLAMGVMAVTHFLALDLVEAAYMIAVKRTSLLFGIVYGALWFHEERLAQHLAAGAVMLAGVVMLSI
ncbi:MAG: DMT family transporter [Gammaproteobacteria bacterium]|nr:DMT family transporter [Gammaproteobacteria bacterium]